MFFRALFFSEQPSDNHDPARTSPGEAPPPPSKIGGDDNDSKFTIGSGLMRCLEKFSMKNSNKPN